jgi:hypothetical protein
MRNYSFAQTKSERRWSRETVLGWFVGVERRDGVSEGKEGDGVHAGSQLTLSPLWERTGSHFVEDL